MGAPPTSKVEGPEQRIEAATTRAGGDAPRVSRRARIAQVIGIDLLAPIAIVLGALAVWPAIDVPENGVTVGAVRVLPAPEQEDGCIAGYPIRAPFETAFIKRLDCPELLPQFGIDGVIALGDNRYESPERRGSIRLGDVVEMEPIDGSIEFLGAVYDRRLQFKPDADDPTRPIKASGIFANPAHAGEPEKKSAQPSPTQQQAPQDSIQQQAPQKLIQQQAPQERTQQIQREFQKSLEPPPVPLPVEVPVLKQVPPALESEESRGPDFGSAAEKSSEQETGLPSNVNILASAITVGLLRADQAGLSSVMLVQERIGHPAHPEWEFSRPDWFGTVGDAIRRVGPRLVSLDTVYLAQPFTRPFAIDELARMGEGRTVGALRRAWGYLSTPLPWPDGGAFLLPRPIGDIKTTDTATLINPAYAMPMRSTGLPALIFVVFGVLALARYWQRRPDDRIAPSRFGVAGGVLCAVLLGLLLYALRHLSPLMSGSMVAAHGDFFLVGAVFVAASGAAAVAGFGGGSLVRAGHAIEQKLVPRPDPGPAEDGPPRDNVLRSILYSDNPIDSLDQDRLGFRPVVEALHRFLDNKDTKPPVVVAVNGPWGSGKSSLMKMLATRLRRTRRFHVAWFNAWQYHREEQILAAFLKTVATELRRDWGPWFSLRLAWVRFKHASFKQYFLMALPPTLLIIGLAAPQLLEPLKWVLSVFTDDTTELASKATTVTGAGGFLWLARFLLPFQLQFRKLSAVRDPSARIGFVDDFRDEFRLYRDAMGVDQKFLIIIDDLDRCLDKNIVEVLKTINLIVSGEGAGSRTFFMLGYDPNQVIPSVELHFQDLIKNRNDDGHFGQSFMKKIVTLAVSVPHRKSEDASSAIADRLDPSQAKPEKSGWYAGLADWATDRAGGLGSLVLALAAILGIILLLQLSEPLAPETPAPTPAGDVASEQATPDFLGKPDVKSIAFPTVTVSGSTGVSWLLWLSGGALLVFVVLAFARRIAAPTPEAEFRRPTEDTKAFKRAIERCGKLMPENPRDIVRLLNLMRLTYLVQSQVSKGETYRGVPLDEWESVTLTLLQQRHPEAFGPRMLESTVIPAAARNRSSAADLYGGLDGAVFERVAADIRVLSKGRRRTKHFANDKKLLRFHDVNYYELATAEELAKGTQGQSEPTQQHTQAKK